MPAKKSIRRIGRRGDASTFRPPLPGSLMAGGPSAWQPRKPAIGSWSRPGVAEPPPNAPGRGPAGDGRSGDRRARRDFLPPSLSEDASAGTWRRNGGLGNLFSSRRPRGGMASRSVLPVIRDRARRAALLAAGCSAPAQIGDLPSISTFSPERVAFDDVAPLPSLAPARVRRERLRPRPRRRPRPHRGPRRHGLRLRPVHGDGPPPPRRQRRRPGRDGRPVLEGYPRVHGLALGNGTLYFATPTTVYAAPLGAGRHARDAAGRSRTGLPSGGNHQAPGSASAPTAGSTSRSGRPATRARRRAPSGRRCPCSRTGRDASSPAACGTRWASTGSPSPANSTARTRASTSAATTCPPRRSTGSGTAATTAGRTSTASPWSRPAHAFDPPGTTKEAFAPTTEPPCSTSRPTPRRSSSGSTTGRAFPAEYRGDAFVTLHGSWNRNPPNGYRVARLRFSAAGEPVGYDDFLTGFLYDGNKVFGRPAGLAVLPRPRAPGRRRLQRGRLPGRVRAPVMTASARRAALGTGPHRGPPGPGRPSGTRPSPALLRVVRAVAAARHRSEDRPGGP